MALNQKRGKKSPRILSHDEKSGVRDIGGGGSEGLRLLPKMDALQERIEETLVATFKHDGFRPGQLQTIRAIMEKRDTLTIFSTGQGKSLCYQLPACMLRPGLTIVVSPLIALMNDQVQKLKAAGIEAAAVHSDMTRDLQKMTLEDVRDGKVTLLYVSPEQLGSSRFFEYVLPRKVALLAIDEAHCVSTWGHDFRPSYLNIRKTREKLGDPPLALFTATAPPHTRKDMKDLLGVRDCQDNIGPALRDNISFKVERFRSAEEKDQRLVELLRQNAGPTIIYCSTVPKLEQVSQQLTEARIPHLAYHAKMEPAAKELSRRAFNADKVTVIVATKAFGMGVDKPNVRRIIHYQIPGSLEEYYQEVGRAGRDGKTCEGILLFHESDLPTQVRFIEGKNPSAAFIAGLYAKLHKFYHMARNYQKSDITAAQLFRNIQCSYKDDRALQLARSAYGILVEYGYIRIEGDVASLPKEPEKLVITDALIDEKRSREYRKLDVMLYYAKMQDDEPAEFIRSYMEESTAEILRGYPSIEDVVVKTLYAAVAAGRASKRQHAITLTARGRVSEEMKKNPMLGMLSFMSQADIEFKLEAMVMHGYVKEVQQKDVNFLVLTEKGEALANTLGIGLAERQGVLEDVHTPMARKAIGGALASWIDMRRKRNVSLRDWAADIHIFAKADFDVDGKKLKGAALLAKYLCRDEPPRTITYGLFSAFIEFYTGDILPLA